MNRYRKKLMFVEEIKEALTVIEEMFAADPQDEEAHAAAQRHIDEILDRIRDAAGDVAEQVIPTVLFVKKLASRAFKSVE